MFVILQSSVLRDSWKKEHKDNEPKMAHDCKEIVFSKHIKAGAHYRLTVR